MKYLLTVCSLLLSALLLGQDINMQTATVNQCGGVFYDSGGEFGNYSDNENFILTICPERPGQKTQIDFRDFVTQLNLDVMSIFNGDTIAAPPFGNFSGGSSPGLVRATQDNISGCITIQFVSSPDSSRAGWAANISCITPCQTINSQIDATSPSPNADNYIRVCPDEEITLTGSAIFSIDGTGATYEWDLGNGNTVSGETATFSYRNPGVYIVNLNVRDTNTSSDQLGCKNSNLINQVIQVATKPDFTGTQATNATLCFGESMDITGEVVAVEFINDCTPPVSGVTFLQDGNGAVYQSPITVDCYDSAQTITDISQLVSICITMEHSYMGDLDIEIVSPNGQVVRMHDQGGGSANLGVPWATGTVDGESFNTTPGVGRQYCFVPNGGFPTLAGGVQGGGTFPSGDGPLTYNDSFVPAGNYSSISSLDAFIGSPLNGDWALRIIDNINQDNGHIFAWGIEFDPSLQPPELSFVPVITSKAWDANPTITNTAGNAITVTPPDTGQYCYTYRVTDDFGCEYIEEVCIDVLPEIVTENPNNLFVCDTGMPPYIFDLDSNTATVLASATNFSDLVLTYHNSLAEADSDTDTIIDLENYSGTDGETIFIRVEYLESECYEVLSFTLNLAGGPTIEPAIDLELCDDDSNDGIEEFDLSVQTLVILGSQLETDFNVTYHLSFADASSRIGALPSLYSSTNNPEPIFVRVESVGDSNCYNASSLAVFDLVVNARAIGETAGDLVVCDDLSNDGIATFDLSSQESAILGTQDPALFNVSFHESQSEADTNVGVLPTSYTNTIPNLELIYVRVEDPAHPDCYGTTSFNIVVSALPTIVPVTPLLACDDDNDGFTAFSLSTKESEILNGQTGVEVSFHTTLLGADSDTAELFDGYINTTMTTQTVFVRLENSITNCYIVNSLQLEVIESPIANVTTDLELCDEINTGDGLEVFDLTVNEILILNGESGVTASYHESSEDADLGENAILDPANYTNTQSPEQEIYVRVTNNSTGCYDVVGFTVRVNPLPAVIAVTDIIQCELNTDGFASFDLTSKDAEVLNGQDPMLFIVRYYENVLEAEAEMNPLASPYINLTNPQQIFVAITNNETGCSISTQSFSIEVQEAAEANPDMVAILYEQCDDEMDTDPSNASVQFDLATQDPEILDGQDPTNYIVSYYATLDDANLNVSPLPTLYENLTNPQVIYARVDNNTPDIIVGNSTSVCYAVTPLTLQVNPLPEFDLDDRYILCINTNGTEIVNAPVLDTDLSDTAYSFEWSYNGTILASETSSSLVATQGGSYSVIVRDISSSTVTSCTGMDTAEVIESEPPMLVAAVVTELFGNSNVIEAVATGIGDYEYNLDGGSWQDSGVFTDVSSGLRVITARDKIGCGMTSVEVFVIDYPSYFTPNGDNNHDTWNIAGIGSSAIIYIFDRYGKLIKQLSPTGSGWDGTFNGNRLPTSDYWFTVIYNEPQTGDPKEFRAHFTLKR